MKRNIKLLAIIAVFLAGWLWKITIIQAQPTFNPHYIIADSELEDYNSMDQEAIKAFLLQYNSALANMQAVDASGTTRFIYEIIYNASQDYRINPRYTLVTLQKEQSLIEDTTPSTKQLNWAMGYGVCDSCSLSDPALQKYKGIGVQIDYAVGTQRIYLDDSINRPWLYQVGRTYTIDNMSVTMSNRATAALYNYTPHLHGNELFFQLWRRYFNRPYPDGSLLKISSSPDIWLIDSGFRRRFTSWTSLITRYNPKLIIEVDSSILMQFEIGREIKFPQYALLKDSATSKTYLYADDKKRFIDDDTFKVLGFNPEEVEIVPSEDLAVIPNGDPVTLKAAYPLGGLFKERNKKAVYFIQDGVKHLITDDSLLKFLYPTRKVKELTSTQMAKFDLGDPVILPDGTLAKVTSSPEVFVISHGQKRSIVSGELFESLGYKWENIHVFSQAVLDLHPFGQAVVKPIPVTDTTLYSNYSSSPVNTTPPVNRPSVLPTFPPTLPTY